MTVYWNLRKYLRLALSSMMDVLTIYAIVEWSGGLLPGLYYTFKTTLDLNEFKQFLEKQNKCCDIKLLSNLRETISTGNQETGIANRTVNLFKIPGLQSGYIWNFNWNTLFSLHSMKHLWIQVPSGLTCTVVSLLHVANVVPLERDQSSPWILDRWAVMYTTGVFPFYKIK